MSECVCVVWVCGCVGGCGCGRARLCVCACVCLEITNSTYLSPSPSTSHPPSFVSIPTGLLYAGKVLHFAVVNNRTAPPDDPTTLPLLLGLQNVFS